MTEVPDHAQDGLNPTFAGVAQHPEQPVRPSAPRRQAAGESPAPRSTILDWSDKHKIARLEAEVAMLKRRAAEREDMIAQQARTLARLYMKLRNIRGLADEGVLVCITPASQQREDCQS